MELIDGSKDGNAQPLSSHNGCVVIQIAYRLNRLAVFCHAEEYIGNDLAMTTRPYNEYMLIQDWSPMNSWAVACPGWLMPSRLNILITVMPKIFRSNLSDR